jgi:hypothetical protein
MIAITLGKEIHSALTVYHENLWKYTASSSKEYALFWAISKIQFPYLQYNSTRSFQLHKQLCVINADKT